jgi:hypothetical protein
MKPLAAIIAGVGVALLTCGCGGASSASSAANTSAAASSRTTGAVAFSSCMRSHGLSSFPDPNSSGTIPKNQIIPLASSPRFPVAQRACQHLLPNTESIQQQTQQCMLAGDCPQALVRQILTAELRFARCMRSHGVANWPDPTIGPGGRPSFDISAHGLDPHHSPQINTKMGECEGLTGNPPVPMR